MELEPAHVADALVEKLKSLTDLTYGDKSVKTIKAIAVKPDDDSGFTPPYIGVAYIYDTDGQKISGGHVHKIPVTLALICSSSPGYRYETEALREALHYARTAVKKCIGELIVNIGTKEEPNNVIVYLSAQTKPIEIFEADPDLSIVAGYLEYEDHL